MSDLDWLLNVKVPEPPPELVSFWISFEDTAQHQESLETFAESAEKLGLEIDPRDFDELIYELPKLVECMVTIDIKNKKVVDMKWEGTEWLK